MSIDRLYIEAISQTEQVQTLPEGGAREGAQHAENTEGARRSDQVLLSGSVGLLYDRLQLRNGQQNGLAASIRQADRSAEEVGQKIDALKEPLEAIVKNFPPFRPDDEERKKLLRSYSSIRKEIDELTVPPPQEVMQDRKGVELPAPLAASADDRQIADHLSELDGVAGALKELREELAARTASRVEEDDELPSLLGGRKGAKKEDSSGAMTTAKASEVGAEVGRQFAASIRQGVSGDDHTRFLKGLS